MPFVVQMERACDYYSDHGTLQKQAESQLYVGRAYEEELYFDKAMQHYLLAANVFLKANDSIAYAYALRDIAWVEIKRNELSDALKYNMKALKLAEEIGDSSLLSFVT